MGGLLDVLGGLGNGIPGGIQTYQAITDIANKIKVAHALANYGGGQPGGPGGLGGMGGPPMQPPPQQMGPQPQPMAPGQPSMPAQQQPAVPQAPPAAVAGGAPGAPTAAPPPGISAGPPQPPPGQQQAPPGQGQDMAAAMDPMAPVRAFQQLAQEIKAKNPGIEPVTLMMATEQIINSSKGLDPALRAGMQLIAQQMRGQQGMDRAQLGATTREDVADKQIAGRSADVASRGQTSRDVANINQRGALERAKMATDRALAVQAQINQRFSTGQGNTVQAKAMQERARAIQAQLTAAARQLAVLKNPVTGVVDETDPRVQKANKDIDEANAKLDALESRLNSAQPVGGTPPATDILAQAKDAIAKGAPRDKVIQRLKAQGVPTAGL